MSDGGELTARQKTMLWIVAQNGPATVRELARHANASEAAERARLERLEWRGLVARRYGGTRSAAFEYVITPAGARLVEDMDKEDEDG